MPDDLTSEDNVGEIHKPIVLTDGPAITPGNASGVKRLSDMIQSGRITAAQVSELEASGAISGDWPAVDGSATPDIEDPAQCEGCSSLCDDCPADLEREV